MSFYRKSEIPEDLHQYFEPVEIGLESSPSDYVATMVRVFREIWRVLRSDGTAWLNLGDSYNSASDVNRNGAGAGGLMRKGQDDRSRVASCSKLAEKMGNAGIGKALTLGLKPKDLIGIPWRVAFALQADGWYLRSEIIWSKPNPMPESVTDRPTKSHEQVFLLAKSGRYFFDAEAVREKAEYAGANAERKSAGMMEQELDAARFRTRPAGRTCGYPSNRNIRSVWDIATEPCPMAHFAVMPRKLVEPCVRAGTSQAGCCPACGRAWERVVELGEIQSTGESPNNRRNGHTDFKGSDMNCGVFIQRAHVSKGFRQACPCPPAPPRPCLVLDPFSGAGTVGVVATGLGRRYVGFDLSAEYLAMGRRRIERPHSPARKREKAMPLFDSPAYYECEDCGITRNISELTDGCPGCGQTMTPAPSAAMEGGG